jgi:hypothetical protein
MNKTEFMGMNGFVWFFGRVVDINDPATLGRVRVRVHGIHPEDTSLVKDEDLPWAVPIQPVTSAGFAGIGFSPTGLLVGSQVFGFFADGEDCQIPFVLGSIALGIGHIGLTVSAAVKNEINKVQETLFPPKSLGQLAKEYPTKAGAIGNKLMQDLGLTKIQASAILGNLYVESGVKPDIRFGGATGPAPQVGTSTYGWAQWRGPRLTSFINHVKQVFNVDITTTAATDDHNYSYFLTELKSSEKAAVTALKTTTDLNQATTIWMQKFERAGAEGTKSLPKRIAAAQTALESLSGSGVPLRSTGKETVKSA